VREGLTGLSVIPILQACSVVWCYLSMTSNSSPPYRSLFKLNIHNRLTENMSVEGVNHLTRGIQRNGEKGGSLTTLNIMMNIINLACSQGLFVPLYCAQNGYYNYTWDPL
jgi:hypothetical protein